MPRPQPALAELEARHSAEQGQRAANARGSARSLARELGVSIPQWAAKIKQHAGTQSPLGGRPVRAPASSTTPINTYLPSELRDWRRRTPGSIVQVGQSGIVLHEPDRKRVFQDMAAAVA